MLLTIIFKCFEDEYMETVETNDTKGWIIGAIVLVVVVGGGWWMIKNSKASSTVVGDESAVVEEGDNMVDVEASGEEKVAKAPAKAAEAPAKAVVTTEAKGESVSTKDQAAGAEVMVDAMTLSAASWVAIKDTKGVLGAAWFPSYATKGSVSLLRNTVAGATYQAVVYVDDGDKKFDMHKDTLVSGVGSSFVAK